MGDSARYHFEQIRKDVDRGLTALQAELDEERRKVASLLSVVDGGKGFKPVKPYVSLNQHFSHDWPRDVDVAQRQLDEWHAQDLEIRKENDAANEHT